MGPKVMILRRILLFPLASALSFSDFFCHVTHSVIIYFPVSLAPFSLQLSGLSDSHVQLSVAMDACARIRGVPIRPRVSVRKEVCLLYSAFYSETIFGELYL